MKITLKCLNGLWLLSRDDQPSKALVLRTDNREQLNLLAFLGLAKHERGDVQLVEGEVQF